MSMRQRIGRRLLSIMLSVLMLVSLLPTAVFAEDLQKTTAGVTEQVGEEETTGTVKNSSENEGSTGTTGTTVTTGDELIAAIDAANNGDMIYLGGNVEVDALTLNKGITIKSEGPTQYEIKGLAAIKGENVTLENVYLNLTQTLEIGGTNTTLTNCTIRAKDLSYRDCAGITSGNNTYLTRVMGTNVTMNGCTIDGTSNGADGYNFFPNMLLAPVSGTDVTMINCTFNEGFGACYYSTPKGTWTLDGCKFTNIYCYNIQAGDTLADIVVKNCELAGWNSFGSDMNSVSFENCSFAKSSGYATVVAYKDATFTNCTFTEDYKGKLYVEENTVVELNGCKVVDAEGNVSTTVGLTGVANTQSKTTNLVAIDATKDANGKYTGGTFVGNEKAVNEKLAETPTKNDDGTYSINYVAYVNGKGYTTLEKAFAAATPDENGIITYEIYGKAEVSGDQWISFVKNATNVKKVVFIGNGTDAKIGITSSQSILGVQNMDIDVEFTGLTLSHPNGAWVDDLGHATNYFACMVRNAGHTVTYTNCTFPNGACNNQYGKTVFDNCKFTNATTGMYNLWNYGGSTEIKNSTFIGTRGIKTYNEGTLPVAPTVKVENTTFDGLTEKAAIVVSKATDVTLEKITAKDCGKGLLQKDIEGSSLKTTIEANGTGISGEFNITATTTEAAAKEEFNITAGTFDSKVSKDYLAEGFELKQNDNGTYGVDTIKVAQIGENKYASLAEAVEAATAGETITLLTDTTVANVIIAKDLTIDLNSKTVSTNEGGTAFTISAGNVTIMNGTVQSGTVVNGGNRGEGNTIYVSNAANSDITLNIVDATIIGSTNEKSGVTNETVADLIAGGMHKYQTTAGTAIEIYSNKAGKMVVNVTNSTVRGGHGTATNGTQTEYISGGANQAYGGVGIYARGEDLTLNISGGSKIYGGDSDNKDAGKALDLQKCAVSITDSEIYGGNGYGIAGSAVYSSTVVTEIKIENSTVKGGDAQTSWNGAGIELTRESPIITIKDSSVIGGQGTGNTRNPHGYAIDSNSSSSTDKITLIGDVTLKANEKSTVVNKTVMGDPGFTLKDAAVTVAGGTLKNVTVAVADGNTNSVIKTEGTATVDTTTVASADGTKVLEEQTDGSYTFGEAAAQVVNGGNVVAYKTLADAIAAAKDGDTVKLLADVTADVTISKNITLDLGGKTLTNTNAGKDTIFVSNGVTATVQNGTVKGGTGHYTIAVGTKEAPNGTLTLKNVTATAGNTGSSMIDNWGTLTIESGTYEGGLNVVKSEEGSKLTINGGKFTLDYATDGYTAVILVYGDTTITGGEFIQSLTTTGRWAHPQVVATGVEEGYTAITKITGGTFTNNKSSENIFRGIGKATSDNFEVSGGTFNKSVPDGYFATGYFAKKTDDGYTVDGPYAVRIGTTGYDTLEAAIEAMNSGAVTGTTITLLQDVTESVVISKNTTIDLNGKTLTNNGAANTIQVKSGKLTVTDNKAGINPSVNSSTKAVTYTSGKIVNDQPRSAKCVAVKVNAGASFVLTKGTLESQHNYALNVTGENASATVNGGYIVGPEGAIGVFDKAQLTVKKGVMVGTDNAAIAGNGNAGNGDTTITISGGTIIGRIESAGYIACGIYHPQSGTLNISGGTIYAVNGVGILMRAGVLNMTSGKIVSSGDVSGKVGDANVITTCYGVYVDGSANYPGAQGTEFGAKISGTANIAADADVPVLNLSNSDATTGTIEVSGGTFTSAVPENYCADGYIPEDNGDGTYGVKGPYVAKIGSKGYEKLQDAIDVASRNATVTLLADTRENITISTPYLTLDLNGFTLNGGTEKGKPALTVTARVTVKDSSGAQTGTIMREDTAENSGVSSHYVIDIQGGGWLTFESGIVKNDSGNTTGKGASLVRVGDDSVAKYPGLNIKGGTFTQDNFIVIKVDRGDLFLNGGTLNSAHSYAIEDWHRATIKGGTVNGTVAAWTYSGGHNSDLTISGGTVNGNVASVSYDKTEGKLAKVSITGGAVNGTLGTYTYGNGLIPIDDATKATIKVTGGTFDKDPTKYVVEGSTVNENTDGTFGVEKAYLAKVGNTSYYTMDEAFKAQTASGEPIVMLRDYTTGSPFSSGSINRTVDLNGCTWTCTGTDTNSAAFEINYSNVTLTVKNGTVVSSQLVGLIPSAMSGTIKYDNAGLVFDSVKMMTTAHSGIETNGNNTNDTVKLVNSELNVPSGFGIYFPSSGKLTIDNSTINAKTMGVQVCAGSLSINDGSKITVSGGPVDKTENDGAIQDGAAISIVNRTGYKGLDKIEVTGGTFKANGTNAAIKAYGWANKTESDFDNSNGTIAITGGTFSSKVDLAYCAPNHEPTANDDGTYTVAKFYEARIGAVEYETLQEAFDAVTTEGQQTIVLLHDVTVTETLKFDKTYNDIPTILKMQGFTITGDGCRALQIVNGHLRIEGRSNKDTESIITSTGIGIASSVIRVGAEGAVANSKQNLSLAMGVTVTTDCSYGITVFGDKTEILSVENSKVISTANHNADYDGCAIATLGTDKTTASVTIKSGAVIKAEDSNAIYMPSGSLLVYGDVGNYPTVTGLTGIYAKSGRVTIKGANIYGTGVAQGYIYNGNGGVPTGDALVIDNCGYPAGVPTVSFGDTNAPNFVTTNAKPIGSYAHNGYTKVTGFVDKGTFNKAIDKDLLAKDYVCVYNAETDNYGVATTGNCVAKVGDIYYETLQDAINAAQKDATVTLVNNVNTPDVTYVINKDLTIDLSGMTVTGSGYDGVFQITGERAKVLIKNGSVVAEEGSGSAGKYAMAVWACAADCKVTLEDLNVSQKITSVNDPQMDMIYTSAGTIIINSGNFKSGTPKWTLNCNDAAYKAGTADIIVNGGTFVDFDPMNGKTEGKGTSFVAAGVGVNADENGNFTAVPNMIAQRVDADGNSVKAFDKLSDALTAAEAGQTVKLLDNVSNEMFVMVKTGVTLDLAGKNITDTTYLYVTGTVKDTADVKGYVKAELYAVFGNAFTPVYDSEKDGYSFFDLDMDSMWVPAESKAYFALKQSGDYEAAAKLMEANNSNRRVKAVITFSWDDKTSVGHQSYEFIDEHMSGYLSDVNAYALFAVVRGLDELGDGATITAQAKFVIYDAAGHEMYTLAGNSFKLEN